MKYANTVSEMLNAFETRPLEGKELDEFYYADTMKVRMGDDHESPILDIFDACEEEQPSTSRIYLLLGHRGCGKSTELNEMSKWLSDDDYQVDTIPCGLVMDPYNLDYSDLLIAMGDTLLKMANKLHCHISEQLLRTLLEFWDEKEITRTTNESHALNLQASAAVQSPPLLQMLLKLGGKVTDTLKFTGNRREEVRERVRKNLEEWNQAMNELSDLIAEKLDGRQPILIFEDLDKLEPDRAWEVFEKHASSLSAFTFPVIYTFPIALFYDTRFKQLESSFQYETLPMIMVERLEGGRCDEGFDTIRSIVEKRVNLNLFEEDVLDLAIEKSGGSLRDLFKVILKGATRARRRRSQTVSMVDVQQALKHLKSDLTSRIESKDYVFLANIANGNRKDIEDQKELLKMLQGGIVLEYNGDRWHNVHPLVTDFLREQGHLNHEG